MKNILLLFSLIIFSTTSFCQGTPKELAEEAIQFYQSNRDSDVFKSMIGLEGAIRNYLYFDAKKAHATLEIATIMADTSKIDIVNAMAFYLSGTVEKSTGDLKKAIKLFEQAESIFNKENLLRNTPGDEIYNSRNIELNKAHMKKEIGDSYRIIGEISTAKNYFKEYLVLAEKNKDDVAVNAAYVYLGICSDLEGDYHAGIEFYTKALEHAKVKDLPDTYSTYGNIAISYYYLGERGKSLEYHIMNANGAEAVGNKLIQANAYGNVRIILSELEDYEGFFEYGVKAEKVFKETENKQLLARLYNSNANIYVEMDSLGRAMEMVEESLAISQKNNISDSECTSLKLKGNILQKMNDLDVAEKWLTKAVEYGKSNGLVDCEYASRSLLGSNYVMQNKSHKAISILTPTLTKFEADENTAHILDAKSNISKAYASIGNYDKAYHLLLDCTNLNDTLNDLSKVSDMARMESDYQFEKEKELIELENQKQQEVLLAKANTNRAIAYGIGSIALLGFLFFYNARRKNKVIAQKNEQLESLNHTKDQIFSIIGHDLKKPALAFRGITSKLNYLLKKNDIERLLRFGDSIETEAIELNRLTDNLLNWALLQKDLVSIESKALSLNDLVEENMVLFSRIAKDKKVILESYITVDSVNSDRHVLSTVIRNLIDNAIKYTPEGGTVRITAEEHEEKIMLSVQDNGIGMAEKQISGLFMLNKGKSTKGTAGEGGTGLGLHLVHELVKKVGGQIKVASKLDSGTRFDIQLPVQPTLDVL